MKFFFTIKLGNMLMNPKGESSKKKGQKRPKGDSDEDDEAETARLLNEDPLDWMLKKENIGNMLAVSTRSVESSKAQNCSNVSAGQTHNNNFLYQRK